MYVLMSGQLVTLGSLGFKEKIKHLWFTSIISVFLKIPSSWDVMPCHWWVSPNIWKECSVFIFRVKQSKKILKVKAPQSFKISELLTEGYSFTKEE